MMKRVLIADNDQEVVDDLTGIFRREGFDVVSATNVEEFEQVFFRSSPDLILMETFFGERSGPDVYDRVMKLGGAPQTPVIFLAGKFEGTKESPLVPGRQVALYLKPLSARRIVADIRVAFVSSLQKPA